MQSARFGQADSAAFAARTELSNGRTPVDE
jgi:hypothetical protein